MARLFLQKPEIILADEPVASLDPARADDSVTNADKNRYKRKIKR